MRSLLKVNRPVESANTAAEAGKLGMDIASILGRIETGGCILHRNTGRAQLPLAVMTSIMAVPNSPADAIEAALIRITQPEARRRQVPRSG